MWLFTHHEIKEPAVTGSLEAHIRSHLERDPDPEYSGSYLIESMVLLRQCLEEIKRLRELASPVWPDGGDDE